MARETLVYFGICHQQAHWHGQSAGRHSATVDCNAMNENALLLKDAYILWAQEARTIY